MEEQEFREWNQKEKEYKDINNLRLIKLQQFLEEREKGLEEKRLNKIGELKAKKDEIVEGNIGKLLKIRVKIIRSIKKAQTLFFKKDKFKRDIIIEYAHFGSNVYAPLTREGKNPDRNSLKLEIHSEYLTTYKGLKELETRIAPEHLDHHIDIVELKKQYKISLKKQEKIHDKAIENAFKFIKNSELKKEDELRRKREKEIEDSKNKENKAQVVQEKENKLTILDDIKFIQRLLRGRKEQNKMINGKNNRAELIKELRSADGWKSNANDEDREKIEGYQEKLTTGLIDAIQGNQISKTLDFLSKEMVRIRQEQKINLIVNQAENERRKREAEEMGRRQAETIIRDRQVIIVHLGTNVQRAY